MMWWPIGILLILAGLNVWHHRPRNSDMVGGAGPAMGSVTYRSRDGTTFFRFRLSPMRGDIRIHILESPNPHVGSCHVLDDGSGPYICWSRSVSSTAEAKAVAAIWAEATLVYQRQGRTF